MKVYSFLNIVALVNGVELTGWADGDDAINVERLNDSASHRVGAAGEMMVSLSTDKSGEITFRLLPTSDSNKYLSDLVKRQEGGADTFTPVSVRVQDTYRQDLASGAQGYIKKMSSMQRGANAGNQEWTIVVENLDHVFGAGA